MNLNQFSKISINILGGIFLSLIFFVSLFPPEADAPLAQIFIRPALAQDAIQCTPGDVNLNRNLKFVNNDNIYLGTGKLNFSGTDAGLYAANDSGNLLLKSPAAILLQSNNKIEFQNAAGSNLAGIYDNGAPPALNNGKFLIVNGKIEGWQVNGLDQLCVQGNCIDSWPAGSCGAGEKLTKNGANFTCSADIDTRCDVNGTCANVYASSNMSAGAKVIGGQLCVPDGSKCISSWADVLQSSSGGEITIANSSLIIGSGGAIKNSGIFEVCDATGVDCFGTGRGVSKIIAGQGITITSTPADGNPGAGEGDVTISATGAAGNGGASGWRLIAQASNWTEENETIITYPDQVSFNVDKGFGDQRVNIGNFDSWSPSGVVKIIFKVKNIRDDFCAGGNSTQNLLNIGGNTNAQCQDWQLDIGGASTNYVDHADDDWIRLHLNGAGQPTCPDQLGRISPNAAYPGTYGHEYWDTFCYYTKNTNWSGDLTEFKVQEVDWSGAYGSWEWEIWGCEDCTDTTGLAGTYLSKFKHTKAECATTGGTVINVSGQYICKFSTATDQCPASWLQYNKWSTAVPRTCSDNGLCSGAGETCTTGSHAWSDATQESCVYHHHWSNWTGCHGGDKTCYSDITEIGCY